MLEGQNSQTRSRIGPVQARQAARRWAGSLRLRPLVWLLPFVLAGCLLGRAWAGQMQADSPADPALLAPALIGPALIALWRLLFPVPSPIPTPQARGAWRQVPGWRMLWALGVCVLGLSWAHAARRWTPPAHDVSRLAQSGRDRMKPLAPVQVLATARVLEVRRGEWKAHALLDLESATEPGPVRGDTWRGRVWAEMPRAKRSAPTARSFSQEKVEEGDWISTRIEVREARPPGSEGERDGRLFALVRGAWCEGEVLSLQVLAPRAGWREVLLRSVGAARAGIASRFDSGFARLEVPFARQTAAVATAMAFGEGGLPAPLPRATRESFRRAGVSHVLVASGAQVALVCAFLWAVAQVLGAPFGRGPWKIVVLALVLVPALIFYALLVGGAASIWRATLIGLGAGWILARGRRADALSAWCGALGVLLLADPASLFDLSLQLSFGATWGLLVFARPLQERMLAPFQVWQPQHAEVHATAVGYLEGSFWKRFLRPQVLAPAVAALAHRGGWRALRGVCAVAAVSIATQVGTLPVLLHSFGALSLGALCANVPIVPLSALLVLSGGASLLIPIQPLHALNYWLADSVVRLAGAVASWRAAWIEAPPLSLAWTGFILTLAALAAAFALWPSLLLLHRSVETDAHESVDEDDFPFDAGERSLLWRATIQAARPQRAASTARRRSTSSTSPRRGGRARTGALAVLALSLGAAAIAWWAWRDDGRLRVTVLDVGQGECIVARWRGRTFVVDGGSSDRENVGRQVLAPFLQSAGVRRVDALFVTHPDADHFNALPDLLREVPVGRVFLTRDALALDKGGRADDWSRLLELCRSRGVPIEALGGGQVLDIAPDGGASALRIHALWPRGEPDIELTSDNDRSLVLKLELGASSVLLCGDIEAEAERALQKEAGARGVTVLKAAHHGSKTSTTASFLEHAAPRAAVISCGRYNRFKHPAPQVLDRLAARNIPTLRTDLDGSIEISCDGAGCALSSFR
jgi:competence protein ComEC